MGREGIEERRRRDQCVRGPGEATESDVERTRNLFAACVASAIVSVVTRPQPFLPKWDTALAGEVLPST